MKRRALLAALAPLTAGCFGATGAQTTGETEPATPTPEETPTPTPEETPTETPEETPTETPEPTPSGDRTAAIEQIDTAQDRLREAVYIYTGGVSNDLLDVSADTAEFDDRSVLLKLSDAQTAINEAERVAVTDEQAETVASLRELQRFLTQATDLQAWLIEGNEEIVDVYDAIDDGDDESTVEAALDDTKRVLEETSQPLEVITEGVDLAATTTTDVIGKEEFEGKRTQFKHEHDVLEQLHDALSTVQSAREELDAARAMADKGDYYKAEDAAERAADTLEGTVEDLEDLSEDPPSRADAFEGLVDDVLDVAQDYAADADSLHDEYD